MFSNFPLLPEQASTFAFWIDVFFYALTIFVLAFTTGVTIVFVYLGVKYGQDPKRERPSQHVENMTVEIAWSVIPLVIALGIFAAGAATYVKYQNPPADTINIDVIGKRWMWKTQHPNGMREVNTLHVPKGRPVKLTMTSQDVIHNFAIPAFRVRQDVLPARYTTMWFEATKTGTFRLFCAEYCGTEHSTMVGLVHVLEPAEYELWLSGGPALTPVAAGQALFTNMGCATCHDAGDASRGPVLHGLFGTEVELTDGSKTLFNEDYIRESIMNPAAKVVKGFAPLMPTFSAQLNDEDILNLIAYIKSLGATPQP